LCSHGKIAKPFKIRVGLCSHGKIAKPFKIRVGLCSHGKIAKPFKLRVVLCYKYCYSDSRTLWAVMKGGGLAL
jgi:hypothetical protein